MSGHYTLNVFLRQANKHHIAAHLEKLGIDPGFEPEKLRKSTFEPIMETLKSLAPEQRNAVEVAFRDIFSMASDAGIKALYADAQRLGLDILADLNEREHKIEKAYWVYLEHPDLFAFSLRFLHIETLIGRYWKRRMPMFNGEIKTDPQTITDFAQNIGDYFLRTQGCGRYCKVEPMTRGDKLIFYAFPEDFADNPLVWDKEQLTPKTHRPAFLVIFVYDPKEGLDIYTKGGKPVAEAMQRLFARVFFGDEHIPAPSKPAYAVNNIRAPGFSFSLDPLGAVRSIQVKQLRFLVNAAPVKSITLDLDAASYGGNLSALIRDTVKAYPPGYLGPIVWARLSAEIDRGDKRPKKLDFNLSAHSCNLKYDEDDLLIRDILTRTGIDTTATTAAIDVAA